MSHLLTQRQRCMVTLASKQEVDVNDIVLADREKITIRLTATKDKPGQLTAGKVYEVKDVDIDTAFGRVMGIRFQIVDDTDIAMNENLLESDLFQVDLDHLESACSDIRKSRVKKRIDTLKSFYKTLEEEESREDTPEVGDLVVYRDGMNPTTDDPGTVYLVAHVADDPKAGFNEMDEKYPLLSSMIVADTGNSIYDHFNCLLMRLDGHGSMAFFPSRLVRLQRYEEE